MPSPTTFTVPRFFRRHWRELTAGALALGLLNFFYHWLDDVVRRVASSPWPILVEELTSTFGAAALVPFIVLGAFAWRLDRSGWARWLPLHLAALVVFSTLATSWRWASRSVTFSLLGWGEYDYGAMPMRYLMELPSDAILYAAVVQYHILGDVRRPAGGRPHARASQRPAPAHVRGSAPRQRRRPPGRRAPGRHRHHGRGGRSHGRAGPSRPIAS